ncbi:hypothetical protein PVAND_004163 [Polypedilum vanderplanki]|uniref:Uncharacterized protein n=1 Tax=Polypedilum vanderplanki TaxID=319348 RepID=A0A9J6BWB1_POLVA|nr:hypothetical protein PVAND_004163 [Polypedilum vanderplanki]
MNEGSATAVIETQQQSPTTITITLHPQPNEREILCDNNDSTITAAVSLSPTSDSDSIQCNSETAVIKRSLKLDLTHSNNKDNSPEEDLSFKSPTSPKSPRVRISHQTSLTSQVETVDDRKALRDALYQGIFHRHRRTIFAVGSFLRMLKSRNSQYNTIRSSSEGEEDNAR